MSIHNAARKMDTEPRAGGGVEVKRRSGQAATFASDTARGEDSAKATTKTINLALQGGGAHGAFTWGVLDRLLEDGRVDFEAISATSAGAMNATVFAYGMAVGGREGARKAMEGFWRRISHSGNSSPLRPSFFV